jgi:hypothetical protein
VIKDRLKAATLPDHGGYRVQTGMVQINHLPAVLADQMMVGLSGDELILSTTPTQIGLAQDAQVA